MSYTENTAPIDIPILKGQSLLEGLTDEELRKISKFLKKREFVTNDIIIDEDDTTTDLYLIIEGEVSIFKMDEDGLFNLPLGKLKQGDIFGEMSFMDQSARSSTVEASKQTVVLELSREDLMKSSKELGEIYNKILTNISIININRLRGANDIQIKTLRTSLRKFQTRQKLGVFAICFILLTAFISFVCTLAIPYAPIFNRDFYTFTYWITLLACVYWLIKRFHFYLDEFDIYANSYKKTLWQSLGIALGGIPFIYIISLFISEKGYSYPSVNPILYLMGYLTYSAIFEFLIRGIFQTTIQKFLEDREGLLTILLTTSLATFLTISFYNNSGLLLGSILFFLGNLVLSALFFYQKNIFGVILIHFILGVWARYLMVF